VGNWQEPTALLAGFAGSAFALMRLALTQHKSLTDRFVGYVETSAGRQDETLRGLKSSVDALRDGVRENTQVVRRIAERLHVAER
jgi:hypothetical protein